MTYTETDVIASIERLSGVPLAALTQTQRDHIDQFHAGGPQAVDRLLPGLRLTPEMTVLDVGSGLGGPARQVARNTGCRVVGVDITPAYVEAARALTDSATFGDRVEFVCAEIADLEPAGFDAAYTMHVQMNVADKHSFFAEIARRLRSGARLAIFDVCRNGDARPTPPLPWSLDGIDSHLDTAERLRATIECCGFELLEWADETAWIRQWFQDAATRMSVAGTQATLPAILDDGPTRTFNYLAAIANDVVSVHRASFTLVREQT